MKKLSKKLLFALGLVFLCRGIQIQAQSLAQAKQLYNEGKYAEAKPAFEKLVKRVPSNTSYNQWYGVCCFETGDIVNAEKHLKIAVKRRVQEAYRYMGEIYYQTYRFEEAEEMYDSYITLLSKKKQDTAPFEERMDLMQKAGRMLDKVEDVQIIDSMVVDKADFLSAYTLSEESGKLINYQDFFETDISTPSAVYMNQKGDKIYYGHPSEDNTYSLFTQSKLMNKWGDEKKLAMNTGAKADDNFPFVLTDGVTIYYASKGNNTLGGYDLFVTRYNIESDNYLAPQQLGMPFNSPYNDYMMVIDENKQLGWFVSDRFQPEGKACVYLFIPNEDRKRIESEDMELKRSRAAISSIKDSWTPNANYNELIALSHKEIPYGQVERKKDFSFPIQNDIVYYTLDEIKSPEAKKLYEKALTIHKQINNLESKLDKLRTSYIKGNQSKRDQLKPTILNAEEQLDELYGQPEDWEKKARNTEINYLKKRK